MISFSFLCMLLVLSACFLTGCNAGEILSRMEAEAVHQRRSMQRIIRVNGHVCTDEQAVHLVHNAFGSEAYHVTCTCPASGQDTVYTLPHFAAFTRSCTPGLLAYLVEWNPLAPQGSPFTWLVTPAVMP